MAKHARSAWERLGLSEPDPQEVGVAIALVWRGGLIGLVLFLAFSLAEMRSGHHLMDLGIYCTAALWCYVDGAFSRGSCRLAAAEGVVLYILAMLALRFFVAAFGIGPTGV